MIITSEQKEKYLQRRKEDILNLEISLNNKDFESIANIGHKLKGNGSTFGFVLISDVGNKLEIAANNHSIDEIAFLIKQLSKFLNLEEKL